MKKEVLGVGIDDVNINQALEIVQGWLSEPGKRFIVTPNPEFLVDAQNNPDFKRILNNADLAIPDGKGLRIGSDIVCNTPGIDLMEGLVRLAGEKGFTTGFLGGRGQVAELTAERLKKKYPKLKVTFAESGGKVISDGQSLGNIQSSKSLRSEDVNISFAPSLRIPKTDILFVAFGHPKQEKWIATHLDKIPVKVAMGVGGSFDYVSGKVPRAPVWVRNLGLEWLFRLIREPWRIKRQIKLLKYVWYVLN